MTVFRALTAHHFAIYQSVLAFIATSVVLHLFMNFSWLHSAGYGALVIGGFWLGQGMVNLVNHALGYRKNSRSDSLD